MAPILMFVIAVAVLLIIIFKYQNFYGNISNATIAVLLIVLFVSLFYVYQISSTRIDSFEGIIQFGKTYFSWIGSLLSNVKNVVGYAIHQDWISSNFTNQLNVTK